MGKEHVTSDFSWIVLDLQNAVAMNLWDALNDNPETSQAVAAADYVGNADQNVPDEELEPGCQVI